MRTAELVDLYAKTRDAEAFANLVNEYKAMVLATCRRRLRSQADVDDAVQETFLKLARSAGSLRANVAAWLHRCAVNVSIDLNRRAQARARHESAAALTPSDEKTEAQRELAALREHLDAALAAIDEPSRELILQRYFVGRSQVDLAADANVSPSGISQRLDRAIEALRAQLHRAGMPAVALIGSNNALTSRLEAEHASTIVPTELTASLNSIGVAGFTARSSTGLMWAAAVGAMLLLVAGVWLTGQFRTEAPATPAGSTATSQSSSGGGMIAGAASGPNWQAPTEPDNAALFGRVTDEAGKPIANATINLNGGPSTTTDADGRYRIRSVPREAEFLAGVSAPGFVPIRPFGGEQELAIRLTPTGHVQRNWVLQRAVTVLVQVVDVSTGRPPESVRVECALASGDDLGRNRSSETVELDAAGVGTVLLPPGKKPYALMATAKDRAPALLRFTPEAIDEPLDLTIELDAGMTIEGVALCTDGKPATGWSISAVPVDWASSTSPIPFAVIDKGGHFTIPHAPSGKHDVRFNIPDGNGMWAGRSIGTFDFVAGAPALQVAVPMKSPGSLVSISGTIQWIGNPSDKTVAFGVSISAQSLGSRRDNYHSSLRGEPPEQEFTLANVEPGDYRITISGSTFAQVTLDRVTIPGKLPPIKITVAGKPKLAGTVTDAVTGKTANDFAYRLRKLRTIGNGPNYSQPTDWVQVNDPHGKFSVDLVGPGEYQVQVSAADRAWVWSAPFRVETQGESVSLNVLLPTGGSLHGVVKDRAGNPVAGAKVIPLTCARSLAMEDRAPPRFDGEAGAVMTNATGNYELSHLPAGTETLKIVHPDFAPVQVGDLPVTDGERKEAPAVTLSPGGRIEGIVYNNDGAAVGDEAVYFRDRSGYSGEQDKRAGTIAMATTDNEGHFVVDHLAEQTLYASLADVRYQAPGVLRRLVRPQEGKTATLNFGGSTSVSGHLLADGAPKANTKLALSSGDSSFGTFIAQCTTDTDGRFTLRGIPPGRYLLYAEGQRDRVQLREVSVGSDSLDLGDVSDDRGRVTLTIIADDPDVKGAIESIDLTPDERTTGWSREIGRFRHEGELWICDNVPSGKHFASARLKSHQLGGRVAIDRKSGEGELKLSLRLPKRSATLHYVPATQPSTFWAELQDVEGVKWAAVGGDKPLDVTLPPGTFRLVDPYSAADMPLPPISIRDGETIQFTPPENVSARRSLISIWLWTGDGTHITDAAATLVDGNGVTMKPRTLRGHEQLSFALEPGRYTLKIDRPGRSPFEQSIQVAEPNNARNDQTVHVVVK